MQVAILSVDLPKDVADAVRSLPGDLQGSRPGKRTRGRAPSAAGEDSRKKAFAGLQDTYSTIARELSSAPITGIARPITAPMTYRREAISDAVKAEQTGGQRPDRGQGQAGMGHREHVPVRVHQRAHDQSDHFGNGLSRRYSTGCRGTVRNDLVSIDASYGLGEAVVGGLVTRINFMSFSARTARK